MKKIGIDISQNKTKSVMDFYKAGKQYDYVITVCDESQAGSCPVFPGAAKSLHWDFDDPSSFSGTEEEMLTKTKQVRDKTGAPQAHACGTSTKAPAGRRPVLLS